MTAKVGMVLAFTGRYRSVRIIADCLRGAGVDLVTSETTTPLIMQTASAAASSEFCLPLRIFVGHVAHLLEKYPDLDFIVAPNLYREDDLTSTCSKYRDIGGVAIRSLGDTLGYRLKHAPAHWRRRLSRLIGPEAVSAAVARAGSLPRFLQPQVWSAEYHRLFNVCFDLYRAIHNLPVWSGMALMVPERFSARFFPWLARLRGAFDAAYAAHDPDRATRYVDRLWAEPEKPRLALIGRRYLLQDDTLSADLRRYFLRNGVNVITVDDVAFSELRPYYELVDGYFDTHREGQALIDWAAPHVDGFISVGSFGCHPDAFQVDSLADYARASGKPVWTFRYDEAVGQSAFVTRYETILSFLEEQRDKRLREGSAASARPHPGSSSGHVAISGHPGQADQFRPSSPDSPNPDQGTGSHGQFREPLIIWPSMGEMLDPLVEELAHQVGWERFVHAPPPVSEETIQLGNTHFTETCSPFALSTGSMVQSIREALAELRARGDDRPRRILVIMIRGEGPCTVGWYALAQSWLLPELLKNEIERYGHTIELATVGLDGVGDFLHQLAKLGDEQKLRSIVDYVEAWESGMDALPWWRRFQLRWGLMRSISSLIRILMTKLRTIEKLRAEALVRRAHENERGSITRAYHEGLELLREAHSPAHMRRALRKAQELLRAVEQDDEPRPRAVVVGEIYVALVSFANRGAVENLLGRERVEVVEGVTLSRFIDHSLEEWKRRSRANHPLIRPVLDYLTRFNIQLMGQRVREPAARPFMENEVGGEGMVSVAGARREVEHGVQGILHVFPFKCMPEGIAKDAIKELSRVYGVRYLATSFDRETDIERLRTEIMTFAALLKSDLAASNVRTRADLAAFRRSTAHSRRRLGLVLDAIYSAGPGPVL